MKFCMEFGFSKDGRECRLGCEKSNMRIIFSQLGYKLTRDATLREIDECLATIKKQRKALQRKEILLTQRRHKAVDAHGELL